MNVAFDIDDTLWKVVPDHSPVERVYGATPRRRYKQVPDYDLINVLRWFFQNGDKIYVWSAGGVDYAQTIVNKLGLESMVTVIPKQGWDVNSSPVKIDIAFDDADTGLATVDVKVHRSHACFDCGGDMTLQGGCTC